MRHRQGELDGTLVGDVGYPALPFLLTPIGNPTTDEEIRFVRCARVRTCVYHLKIIVKLYHIY